MSLFPFPGGNHQFKVPRPRGSTVHMFESWLGGIYKHVASEGGGGGVKNLRKPGNKVATKGGRRGQK